MGDVGNALYEVKICPNCGKVFTRKECLEDKSSYSTEAQLDFYWNNRVYCSYDCSYKFNAIRYLEKHKIVHINQLKFVAPIEITEVDRGVIKEIKVLLHDQWIKCLVKE